ncbi:MAG: hypothetical protein K5839_07660, partial [Treponemataceae bacterium]|nr:hypothetical protein [Treponemataceae bacterium]
MDKVTIIPLKSVNGVPFGSTKADVRKSLGSDYENSLETIEKNKDVFESKEIKKIEETFKALYQHVGKDPNSFEWPDISEFEEDNDTYNLVQIEYENDKFVSATIYAQDLKHLTIYDHDCSDLEIEKILTLAKDFVWDENDTTWLSKSKQIGIYCSEGKRKIDSITFGC